MIIKEYLLAAIKGMGMGAANVIPGVSGGTIALVTGIFQRLIDALKSFNPTAIKLLWRGRWDAFARHTDFYFLLAVFLGAARSDEHTSELKSPQVTSYAVLCIEKIKQTH